jgi:hypothetical protein
MVKKDIANQPNDREQLEKNEQKVKRIGVSRYQKLV